MKTQLTRSEYLAAPIAIRRYLRRFFRAKQELVIFDVGACECEDTVRYARLFPNSRLFSVEPLPDNLESARALVKQYNLEHRVTILECAFSDRDGEAALHVSSGQPLGRSTEDWNYGNKSSSLFAPAGKLKTHFPWLQFDQQISVQTRRLETIANEFALAQIDFVHMDVQGAELDVLRGAGDFISKVGVLWLEVEAVELYEGQPIRAEIESFLTSKGFVLELDKVGALSGDQLWRRQDLHPRSVFHRWFTG